MSECLWCDKDMGNAKDSILYCDECRAKQDAKKKKPKEEGLGMFKLVEKECPVCKKTIRMRRCQTYCSANCSRKRKKVGLHYSWG